MTKGEIGNLFKKARTEKKMTQKDVADCLNYSAQNVSLWEIGKVLPKMDSVFEFCHALKIEPESFLSGKIIPYSKELKFDNDRFLSILQEKVTEKNVSKKQLENWLCVSRPTLNRILKGEIIVNISQFLTLTEEFPSSFLPLFSKEKGVLRKKKESHRRNMYITIALLASVVILSGLLCFLLVYFNR